MTILSVIIPAYNAEKSIEKCLDSIKKQTIGEKIEIIIVNDGSIDNTEKIILKYIEKNKNIDIKYYSKENEGIAKTRNFGIDKATSKYILFLDSDDYLDKRTIEVLKPYLEKNIEMIKFKLQRVDEKGNILEKIDGPIFEKITGEEAFNKMYGSDVLLDSPCIYIIKKELFKKNKFKFKRTYHEDFGLIPLILATCNSIVSTPYYFYQYVQANNNSITRTKNYEKIVKKMDDVIGHYDNMIERIKKFNITDKTKNNIKVYYTNSIISKLKELKKKELNIYIKEIRKRKMYKNIKPYNVKQLIKRIILMVDIKLYLKMR